MRDAVEGLVNDCFWKTAAILRTKRYHSIGETVNVYKAQVLSSVEYRTSALFHATREVLEPLDRVQTRYLKELGVNEEDALLQFNLAPLRTRRDIAILARTHRAAQKRGPVQLQRLFVRSPGETLVVEHNLNGTAAVVKKDRLSG